MNPGRLRSAPLASLALITITLLAFVACDGSSDTGSPNNPPGTTGRSASDSLSILLMARDVEVGDARLPIVVLLADEAGTRLDDQLDELLFTYRYAEEQVFEPLTAVDWRPWPVRGGAYVSEPHFDRPGIWEIRVSYQDSDRTRVGSGFLQVEEDSSAPGPGDNAPRTVTKTANTVDEVRQISSALDPDPRFYSISLDEALENGRPTVVLFSTPVFCTTQTCGPQLETLGELREVYSDSMDFIHVEIFDNVREMLDSGDRSIGRVAQPVEDWGLITEPWTFVVDASGIVHARFEQFTTFDELSEAVGSVLAAG